MLRLSFESILPVAGINLAYLLKYIGFFLKPNTLVVDLSELISCLVQS